MKINPRALSENGFLKGQDYLSNFPYGCYPALLSSCGWVAIYNVEYVAGRGMAVEAVYEAMRRILPYKETHGTPLPTMMRCSKEKHIPIARIYGSDKELVRIVWESAVPRDILRYIGGKEPHYIAFMRISSETPARHRFSNAADDKEDFVKAMEYFRREHLGGRWVVHLSSSGEERESVRVRYKNHIIDAKRSEHLPRRCVQYPVL